MTISVVSYNLLFNKAMPNIGTVLSKTKPDVICLQEMDTSEENLSLLKSHGYTLAEFSNSFIKFGRVFGQATFYNKSTLTLVSSAILNLPRSYYEVALLILRGINEPRTLLRTDFRFKNSKSKFTVYNLHLSSYQSTNRARARQIAKSLADLQIHAYKHVIVTGDFNYPYGRKQFEKLIGQYDLKEATSNLFYTSIFRFLKLIPFKLKVDYILYRGFNLKKTERVPETFSDHFPILSQFEL